VIARSRDFGATYPWVKGVVCPLNLGIFGHTPILGACPRGPDCSLHNWRIEFLKSGWNEAIEQLTKPLLGESDMNRPIKPTVTAVINANTMQAGHGEREPI
jgi:hypothetical protein